MRTVCFRRDDSKLTVVGEPDDLDAIVEGLGNAGWDIVYDSQDDED